MSYLRDWGIASLCLMALLYACFPEVGGGAFAKAVKAYNIEMAKP